MNHFLSQSSTPSFVVNATTFPISRIGTFADLLNLLFPLLKIGAVLLALLAGLYAAFLWITSSGNPEQLKKAQGIFGLIVVGLIIVFGSFIVVRVITTIFNIKSI